MRSSIGLAQCVALIPGHEPFGRDDHRRHVVRALALQGGDRFSFFLAIPTLIGAGLYSL